MSRNLVIETKGLRKIFISKERGGKGSGKKEVEAVKSIDLAVQKGRNLWVS